ncbi:MAG: cysteine--tRNA ligase, partial [Alphaproteobacteria bacterium]|nr:cysteine--tRNA ligase [Alphaproteobacteria bacterium]
ALRLLFLTTHYHQPFNFTFEGLQQAKGVLDKFYNALLKNKEIPTIEIEPDSRIIDALADDLNTPLALSYLHEIVNDLNKAESREERSRLKSLLIKSAYMLGLLYNNPESWFKGESSDDEAVEIEKKIAARADAKKNKNWAEADAIRDELRAKGVVLEDSPTGTTWKRV